MRKEQSTYLRDAEVGSTLIARLAGVSVAATQRKEKTRDIIYSNFRVNSSLLTIFPSLLTHLN